MEFDKPSAEQIHTKIINFIKNNDLKSNEFLIILELLEQLKKFDDEEHTYKTFKKYLQTLKQTNITIRFLINQLIPIIEDFAAQNNNEFLEKEIFKYAK